MKERNKYYMKTKKMQENNNNLRGKPKPTWKTDTNCEKNI